MYHFRPPRVIFFNGCLHLYSFAYGLAEIMLDQSISTMKDIYQFTSELAEALLRNLEWVLGTICLSEAPDSLAGRLLSATGEAAGAWEKTVEGAMTNWDYCLRSKCKLTPTFRWLCYLGYLDPFNWRNVKGYRGNVTSITRSNQCLWCCHTAWFWFQQHDRHWPDSWG